MSEEKHCRIFSLPPLTQKSGFTIFASSFFAFTETKKDLCHIEGVKRKDEQQQETIMFKLMFSSVLVCEMI